MTTLPRTTPARDPATAVDRDVVVVGGGAAGLSAAVFLARYGLDTLVVSGGPSAIRQCAHLGNYLGFPGGIDPERFLELGRAHARHEGATVRDALVESVGQAEHGFTVETADGETVDTTRVLVASAYDGDYLDGIEGLDTSDPEDFLETEAGRTPISGLYAAGWLTRDTVHQAIVNAGDGARAAMTLIRDDLGERYWPAVGDRYVDWVVDEGRYGGPGWEEHLDEWFEREMLPADHDHDPDLVERARTDLAAEFRGRCIDEDEQACRDRAGQRMLLEAIDDQVIEAYVRSTVSETGEADRDPIPTDSDGGDART